MMPPNIAEVLRRQSHGVPREVPRCVGWPDCGSARLWREFGELDESTLNEFALDWWRMNIRCLLECMWKHCPDRRAGNAAGRQASDWGKPFMPCEIDLPERPLLRRI
jgi:hypothetical protein